ncbi:RNA polymerase sigma factor [Shivajiella indica]|uniref:RNA polymerase sigma factor n=1 Tax=Shivajiella indica TaxID=872115 RepID=A0ABW5B4U0_9BACT
MVDKRIIDKAVKGDHKSERQIYELLSKPLFMMCLRYLKNQEDAEDVLTLAFVKVFQSLSGFEFQGPGSLVAWARKVTLNECLMYLRKQKRSPMMVEPDEHVRSIEEGVIDKLSADELFILILQLPEGYRTVFNLYEIEGYAHHEIAEKLNISLGTSKSQLSKSKAYLRELIRKNGGENATKII